MAYGEVHEDVEVGMVSGLKGGEQHPWGILILCYHAIRLINKIINLSR